MKWLLILNVITAWFAIIAQAEEHETNLRGIPTAADIKAKIEELCKNLTEKGYDPLHLETYHLSLKQLGFDLDLEVTGNLTGQLNLIINKFTGFLLNYKYDITFPEINIDINPYDLTGFLQMIKVFGKGQLQLNLNGLNIAGDIKLTPVGGIKVKKITTNLKLGEPFYFKITGWLNDEHRSTMLSDVINKNLLDILDIYETEINNKLGEMLTNLVKDIVLPIT